MAELTLPARVTLREFDEIFSKVKNWGRWGPDDQLGTLNYMTPDSVQAAAALVRSGRHVTMSIPMNTVAGPDNPSPVTYHVVQGHDIDIGSSTLTFAVSSEFVAMNSAIGISASVVIFQPFAVSGNFTATPTALPT